MRQIKIGYPPPNSPAHRGDHGGKQRGNGGRSRQLPPQARWQGKQLRCAQHPGVQMVLAGSNPRWNTVRYLCPLCSAMGRPTIELATGVVSGFWPERGYGFIENGGPRIFFHVSDLHQPFMPYVGMPVSCVVEQNHKGLVGRQVRPQ